MNKEGAWLARQKSDREGRRKRSREREREKEKEWMEGEGERGWKITVT